jgi:integrase
LYRKTLKYYAAFLQVDMGDLHLHLTVGNLTDYAGHLDRLSPRGRALSLSILHRYYRLNEVRIPELEANVIKQRAVREQNDKPLTLDTLIRMMDLANIREKAMISMLVSTGMRAGELAQLTLEDISGDTVTIPGAVTKGKHGRTVWLNAEAREYLDVWLKGRDGYKAGATSRHFSPEDMAADERLFCASYSSIKRAWVKLYDRVDGERGKYRAKCTLHSTRKYFRTNAVKKMSLDLVETIMGHRGYLTEQYVRIPAAEAREEYHTGEYVLYITRADTRQTDSELKRLEEDMHLMKLAVARLQERESSQM